MTNPDTPNTPIDSIARTREVCFTVGSILFPAALTAYIESPDSNIVLKTVSMLAGVAGAGLVAAPVAADIQEINEFRRGMKSIESYLQTKPEL